MLIKKTLINSVAKRLFASVTKTQDNTQLPRLFSSDNDDDPSLPARLGPPPQEDLLLGGCTEDLSYLALEHKPSFNLAAYADKSKTIQEFVKLGVDLSRIERIRGVPDIILRLNFDRDVRQYIQFLTSVGVKAEDLGAFFTKNPYIFKEDVNDLVVRINYLEAKRFCTDSVSRILTNNPKWLLYKTQEIDSRLGFFQGNFKLIGTEVRQLATKMPKLITHNLQHVEIIKFSINQEMGFTKDESKKILLDKPKVYTLSHGHLTERFNFAHNEMKLAHDRIAAEPSILLYRVSRVRERHLFLDRLKRAQYDPTKPGYVSLKSLMSGSDVDFCGNVAKTEVQIFNQFLRTL